MHKIVFLWENFGPYHIDRLNAVANQCSDAETVVGIELSGKSSTYAWTQQTVAHIQRVTLAKSGAHFFERNIFWQIFQLLKATVRIRSAVFFFCHYEQIAIFITAVILRLLGHRVFIMNDMKYADFKRNISRELVKSIFYAPYVGAIAAGRRSADYFRFLGLAEEKIYLGYGAVSLQRLDAAVTTLEVPAFQDRPFIVVARFMPMKNIERLIDAYHLYTMRAVRPRALHLCGSGPLEQSLRDKVQNLHLSEFVVFRGFLQADDVTRAIASSLCLILYSTQETFGNVIIEALALGVPVIATPICGATDEFLRSGINGFLVEPDNIEGLANIMALIDGTEETWREISRACSRMRPEIDIRNFSNAVMQCTRLSRAEFQEH